MSENCFKVNSNFFCAVLDERQYSTAMTMFIKAKNTFCLNINQPASLRIINSYYKRMSRSRVCGCDDAFPIGSFHSVLETINDKLCNTGQATNHNQCQTAMRFNLQKKTNEHRHKHSWAPSSRAKQGHHFPSTSSNYLMTSPACLQEIFTSH